jgi:hypothetical protein
MEINNLGKVEIGNKVRYLAEIKYVDRSGKEIAWFEVDAKYSEYVASSANPWLLSFGLFAFVIGEPLIINGTVDKTLLENTRNLIKIFQSWFPSKKIIPIEVDTFDISKKIKNNKVASFFTGGVDSFYTLLKNSNCSSGPNIEFLIYIIGFDIPLSNSHVFPQLIKRLDTVAKTLNKKIIIMKTNLMETRYKKIEWVKFFGTGLASASHILDRLYSTVLIAANERMKDYRFILSGDDPEVVPLLSSNNLNFILDGTEAGRIEKTEFISCYEIALNNLKVCSKSKTDINCSNCEKCYRTMTSFYLLNKLDKCNTFNHGCFNIDKLSAIYFKKRDARIPLWQELLLYAKNKNRKDLAKKINKSFRDSRILNIFLYLASFVKRNISFRIGNYFEIKMLKNRLK